VLFIRVMGKEIISKIKNKLLPNQSLESVTFVDPPEGLPQRPPKIIHSSLNDAIKCKYDVIVVMHYWQHLHFQDSTQCLLGLQESFPLKNSGLLIWISAISRQQTKDEFVCEGFPPANATVSSTKPKEKNRYRFSQWECILLSQST